MKFDATKVGTSVYKTAVYKTAVYKTAKCKRTQELLSCYVDTALAGSEMRSVREHLLGCADCDAEHRALEQTRRLVAVLGTRPAPPELGLRIRSAISRARAEQQRRSFAGFLVRAEEGLRAFMLPATAGLLSAIVFFGVLIGSWAIPAISNDVPVPSMSYTPPQLTAMPADSVDGVNEPIMVETYVDAQGRVENYRVLTQGLDLKAIEPQLDSIMIFTLFQPARSFGRPAPGRAVISFSNVHVKG
ncbi:MAG: zf-HC2 domain-containing protein [Acidobacteriota bacterium]|nr:zf-HC2 domain-containing protein [Acidobacteriota bacterium]